MCETNHGLSSALIYSPVEVVVAVPKERTSKLNVIPFRLDRRCVQTGMRVDAVCCHSCHKIRRSPC